MIFLSFKARAVPGSCGELLHALNSMIEDVRDLEGCLSCCCYRSVEDDGDFFFVEQWATQKHLDEHMRSDLYGAIIGAFRVLTEGSRIELTRAEDLIQSADFRLGNSEISILLTRGFGSKAPIPLPLKGTKGQ